MVPTRRMERNRAARFWIFLLQPGLCLPPLALLCRVPNFLPGTLPEVSIFASFRGERDDGPADRMPSLSAPCDADHPDPKEDRIGAIPSVLLFRLPLRSKSASYCLLWLFCLRSQRFPRQLWQLLHLRYIQFSFLSADSRITHFASATRPIVQCSSRSTENAHRARDVQSLLILSRERIKTLTVVCLHLDCDSRSSRVLIQKSTKRLHYKLRINHCSARHIE